MCNGTIAGLGYLEVSWNAPSGNKSVTALILWDVDYRNDIKPNFRWQTFKYCTVLLEH
jgi:hypothetical protein